MANDIIVSRGASIAERIIWTLLGILEAFLAFRFFLKLLGANPNAGFTQFIYGATEPFVAPFLNVFRVTRVEGATFEWTTLLAMFVYWLIAWVIINLITMATPGGRVDTGERHEAHRA